VVRCSISGASVLNDDRPFSSRYNFRQRVEDYCAQRFGLWRWEEIRDELLTHFNSKGKEFLMFLCVNYPRVFTYLNRSSTF